MRQQAVEDKRTGAALPGHHMIGSYQRSGMGPGADELASKLGTLCRRDAVIDSHHGAGFSLASSADSHALASGVVAIVCGEPWFREPELARLAALEGAAAALSAGYERFSDGVFTRIFGSFSCAIVDHEADRILLGIDRLGQQTLYYHADGDGIRFGSTARGAIACIGEEAALLEQGLYNYVYFHMVPSPGTVYAGLSKLAAAHYLDYQHGQCRLVNYWLPAFSDATDGPSFGESALQLRQTLRHSVEKCLRTTAKVGSFLSGGLDSSTVTGMLAELSDRQAAAFAIGFAAEGYDEMAFARITARHFGVKLNEYYVTPQDVVDALPDIATSYDEPFGNSSALPAFFCARMAREHGVDRLLAGDGGDELFGGNERYLKQRVFEHYRRVPSILRSYLIEPTARLAPARLPLVSKANSYIEQANTPLPDRMQSYNFLHRHAAREIFSEEFLARIDLAQPLGLLRSTYNRPEPASDLNRMLYLDWQFTLADNDLRKVSHTCALAGVEVAYPMLDDELVELSCRVPSAWKIKGMNLRHFYKESLEGWLPRETIDKTKKGFGLPFGVWMQSYRPLRELAYDNLLKLKRRGFIRAEFIDKAISMHQSEHAAYYGELVWILTVLEFWLEGRQEDAIPQR